MLPKDPQKVLEYRQAISKRMMGNKNPVGAKRTKEHKAIISRLKKGIKMPQEIKDKVSKSRRGKCLGSDNPAWSGGKPRCIDCGDEILGYMADRCSKCYHKHNTGENNPAWKGGVTSENHSIRNSIEIHLWREAVFSRDNWTCLKCGSRGVTLHCHHIKNFAEYTELRFAIDNGTTFCKDCHMDFHNKYGRKNNNIKQINEYLYDDRIKPYNNSNSQTGSRLAEVKR